MRAIRLHGDQSLRVDELPEPTGDVVVSVDTVGVCGSDAGAYLGKPAYEFLTRPRVLGHEYVGTVESVNVEGTELEPGDRVVERPLRPCGACTPCCRGRDNVCDRLELTGFHHDGAFAPRIASSADELHPVPDGMPDTRAAMLEPLSVAYRGVVRLGDIEAGERVLVLGPGPIGSLAGLLAERAGADVRVVGLQRDEHRLEMLETVGLDVDTLGSSADPIPDGAFDVAVDATGSPDGVETTVDAVRPGGRAVLLGIPSGSVELDVAKAVRSEKQILPSYSCLSEDLDRTIALQSGPCAIAVEQLATEFDPSDPTAAFEAFVAGDVIKPVFTVGDRQP